MPIQIIVDDREPEDIFEVLAASDNVVLSRQRLAVGDFSVDDRLLIERKTLQDFAASVIDGRFFRQALKLAQSGLEPMYILEGGFEEQPTTRISREALQGALITLTVILGLPVLRSLSGRETAWLILTAARQVRRVEMGAVQRSGYRPKGKRGQKLYILQGLPNIGPERAELLLDHFGSVQAIMQAGYQELLQVKGIGKETAKSMREVLR